MATINAYNGYSLDMLDINLARESQYGIAHAIYKNQVLNGTAYPTDYVNEMYMDGTYFIDQFAGNFSTDSSGAVTGGTVTAYYSSIQDAGGQWHQRASVEGFSYSAVAFYNTAILGGQSQTDWLALNVLVGNDRITGSTGDDILFGGIGNDVINGGGGTDTAAYVKNLSDYAIFRNTDGSTSVVAKTPGTNEGTDTLYNIQYLMFLDQTVSVNSFAPPPSVVHTNDISRSGDVTGAYNFIDLLNLQASYGDLIKAFGPNTQAMQNWFNANQASEHRADTFDGLDYIASYGDLVNAFKSAGSKKAVLDAGAAHYINAGSKEGRTTTFNGLDYIASYGDLINAFGVNGDAGAYHYIESGASEGRSTTFDGLDYIASYTDLIKAFGANEQAGAAHFIGAGSREGRATTFDGLAYIASNTDLMNAFGANSDAGAKHYISNGLSERRSTSFDVAAYESAHPDLIGQYASNDAFLTAYINTYKATGTYLT
jgi:hypothetical protein